jgi:hypothetical protein
MPSRKSTNYRRRSTATSAANGIFTTTIHGAKDLKEYINRISEIAEGIRREFDCDVQQPRARVEEPDTFLGSRKFDVTMCRVDHDGVRHSELKLPQCSAFLQAEQAVNDGLELLETKRKMLVNNRQQLNVMVKNLKKTLHTGGGKTGKINDLKRPCEITEEEEGGVYQVPVLKGGAATFVGDLEIENETPQAKAIKLLIQQVQQNHRTVARKLCEQAELIIRALRTRDILAYKVAAENTIQKIIRHADLCRKFIADCRQIACIEYCASSWWMETQRDPMDHSPYYLTAVSEGVPTRFNARGIEYSALVSGGRAPPRILIEVHSATRSSHDNTCQIVFSEYLDEELANTILTEEAVRAFEAEEMPTSYRRDYGTIISNSPTADHCYSVRNNSDDDDDDDDDDDEEDKVWKAAAEAAATRMEWDD